jgi:hypothetical protein
MLSFFSGVADHRQDAPRASMSRIWHCSGTGSGDYGPKSCPRRPSNCAANPASDDASEHAQKWRSRRHRHVSDLPAQGRRERGRSGRDDFRPERAPTASMQSMRRKAHRYETRLAYGMIGDVVAVNLFYSRAVSCTKSWMLFGHARGWSPNANFIDADLKFLTPAVTTSGPLSDGNDSWGRTITICPAPSNSVPLGSLVGG